MDRRIDLHMHKTLSLFVGICYPMPENYCNRSRCFRIFWKSYVLVAYALMLVELVSQAVQITISINVIEILTTCTLSTVYIVQFLLKMAVFKLNAQMFYQIFDEMSAISYSLMQNPFGDDRFIEFHDSYYKPVMKIGLCKGSMQMVSNLGLNILFIVLSWVGMKPKITAAFSWTPFDSSKNPGYTFTCLFEMLCYGSVTARTAVIDLLFWVMIIIPTVQLNYLKHLMEIMLREFEEPEDKEELENKKKFEPENSKKFEFENKESVDEDKNEPKSEIQTVERTPKSNGKDTLNEELLASKFYWWMKHHQRILSNVHNFEALASPFLAANYLASLIDLFMSGFVAISSSHWDLFQRILINAIIMTDAFQLYVVSLAGDMLRESSEDAADFGFTSQIFKTKRAIRQNYLYVLARTRRLIQVRFAGVNPLSTQTFFRLIQLTMTYFITVVQIRNSKSDNPENIINP